MPMFSLSGHCRAVRFALLPATVLLAAFLPASAQEAEIAVMRVDSGGRLACDWTPTARDPRFGDAPGRLGSAFTFSDGARWSATATDGGGLSRGDPTTITWSIVPDGTSIPGFTFLSTGELSSPSNLIAFLDGIHHGGAGPGGADLTQRAWWDLFAAVFDRWSELTGLTYVYEPADDGVAFSSPSVSPGAVGVRGDVRIGGHSIDGQSGSNVLAYNFFPNNGDMVLDTDNVSSFSSSINNYRLFRNTLAHEHGHGIGLWHVCPSNGTKLMEPFLGTNFNGPREDDVLAGNRGYGDPAESPDQNDTALSATGFGDLGDSGSAGLAGLSADGLNDLDFFAFGGLGGATVTATVTPTGTTYLSAPHVTDRDDPNFDPLCTAGTSFDALRQSDLALELLDVDGSTLLALADSGGLGVAETIADFPLPATGAYFLRITGDADRAQMYRLDVSLDPPQEADLSIAKSASDDPSPRGASLWYEVTVTNHGPGPAAGIQVTETLPAGVTFVETEGCAESPAGVPICSLGSLAAGASVSYLVRVTVDASGPSNLTNSVEVSSLTDDPALGNEEAQVSSTAQEFPCTPGAGATVTLDGGDNGSGSVYLAEGTIRAGDGFMVEVAEDVSFIAGARVILGSGFSVESGGRFRARTDDQLDCP